MEKIIDKTGNQINTIHPYKTVGGGWSFDDAQVGLHGEPFVANIPEIIDTLVGDIEQFTAHISHSPIPNHTVRLMKTEADDKNWTSDGWYIVEGTRMKGWLCPATLKYFKDYPENIYVKIEKFKS